MKDEKKPGIGGLTVDLDTEALRNTMNVLAEGAAKIADALKWTASNLNTSDYPEPPAVPYVGNYINFDRILHPDASYTIEIVNDAEKIPVNTAEIEISRLLPGDTIDKKKFVPADEVANALKAILFDALTNGDLRQHVEHLIAQLEAPARK